MFMLWVISIVATIIIADQKNLNALMYFFMSLFLGPIALVIAVVSPSAKKDIAAGPAKPLTPSEARQELHDIRTKVDLLIRRMERIEAVLGQEAPDKPVEFPVDQPVTAELPYNDQRTAAPATDSHPETMEFVFGKYWLNRIGVVLFVVGIGLFINYTFHYFSAWIKIAIGYALAVLFLVWGQRMEKIPRYHKLSWGVLGGAWGLFYLVTYAMHYVPATRVIPNPYVELAFLWLVTVLAIQYNLKYRSWIATAMSYSLGFITLSLAVVDATSVVFWAMLLGSLAYLAYRFDWTELLIAGIIGAYGIYCLALKEKLPVYASHPDVVGHFQICMSLIGIAWIIFLVTFLARQWKSPVLDKGNLQALALNTTAFALLGLMLIDDYQRRNSGFQFNFLMAIALCHAAAALMSRLIKAPRYIVFHCALAISLVSVAVLIKYHQLSVTYWWILQMTMTFALGLYYREVTYRTMGWILGAGVLLRFLTVDLHSSQSWAVGGMSVPHSLIAAAVIAAVTFAFGLFLNTSRARDLVPDDERNLYINAFPLAGTLVLTGWMWEKAPARWLTLHWACLGIALLGVGFLFSYRIFRWSALGLFTMACLRIMIYDLAGVDTIYKIIVVIFLGAALLGVSLVYSKTKQNG